jgi:hypothetical protein
MATKFMSSLPAKTHTLCAQAQPPPPPWSLGTHSLTHSLEYSKFAQPINQPLLQQKQNHGHLQNKNNPKKTLTFKLWEVSRGPCEKGARTKHNLPILDPGTFQLLQSEVTY